MATSDDKTTEQQSSAVIHKPVLPATFANSFWSSDYRSGLDSVFTALDAAVVQSQELVDHVDRRISLERQLAHGLIPPALRHEGFAIDEGASLRIGFEALLTSSVSEAKARQRLADDLERTILVPFSSWSASHAKRISTSRATLFASLQTYESQHALVARLKSAYDTACRNADTAEDEWNFVRARDELGTRHVPPRPDDLPDLASPTSATPSSTRARTALGEGTEADNNDDKPLGLRQQQGVNNGGDGDDDDGRAIRDDADGDADEGLIGRSGATGGSVLGALGRALTVRRSGSTKARQGRRTARAGQEGEQTGVAPDANDEDENDTSTGLHLPAGIHLPTIDANEVKAGLDWSKTKFNSLLSTVVGPQSGFERYEKARKDADAAEEKYKREVIILDRLRLSLEETISTHLPYLQRCESDRLRAATSVLKSFHAAISALPKLIDGSLERVGQALDLCRPEKDLKAIIERRRTGPFQPSPSPFQSHYSDEPSTTFGIDLRKYDETNANKDTQPVPRVLEILLEWAEKRGKEASDEERRKSWLYDVPLASQHSLRAMLNPPGLLAANNGKGPDLSVVDLPVLCATTKLWLLELEQPPFTWTAYDELRSAWPGRTSTSAVEGGEPQSDDDKVEILVKIIGKLPKIHYEVLRSLTLSLARMIAETRIDEALDVYLHKLSLSLARPLLRPRQTTPLSLDDRFPAAVVSNLLSHSEEIFAKAGEVAKKEREDRYRPRRQRTKPVDERVRRSNLAGQAGSPPPPVPRRASDHHLTVDTAAQAPVYAEKHDDVVASPMAATQKELAVPPVPEKQPVDASAGDTEGRHAPVTADLPAPVPIVPTSPVEAPFTPPSPGEEPFVAPSSSSATDEGVSPRPDEQHRADGSGEKPLTASSSLKRSTGPGSTRLRGARGPRPPSQVLARVAALEHDGGVEQGQGSSRTSSEQKRESWTRSREAPAQKSE